MKVKKFQPQNVPDDIKVIKAWLLWKLLPNRDPSKKPVKVPYYVDGTRRRGALNVGNDLRKLASYERALEVYKSGGYSGLGFSPTPDHNLTFIDLDDCVVDGEMSPFGETLIASGTYVEYSPSRKGLRAIYGGPALYPGKVNGHIKNGERVEVYCGSAFLTITGDAIADNPVTHPPSKIIKLLRPVLEGGSGVKQQAEDDEGPIMHPDSAPLPDFTEEHARIVLSKLPESMGAPGSGSWYKVAAALHLQFDGAEEAYDVLDAWSQGLDGYDPDANRSRWNAGFNHGKDTLTTMKNLVFEASRVGTLKVRKETMAKWGLSRPAQSDFEEDVGGETAVLPDQGDLEKLASIRYMLDNPAPPVDWLVENYIARRNVTVLAGGSGTSKSYQTMQLCGRAAVSMEDYGGMKFQEGGFKTLYLAYEDTRETMHMRIEAIGKNLGEHIDIFEDGEYKEQFSKNFQLLTAETLDSGAWLLLRQVEKFKPAEVTELAGYLCDYVKKLGIDLLVFDTASEVHTGEENATGDMVALMRIFRQLATSADCGVLIIQHVQKDVWNKGIGEMNQSTIRGSSAIVDKARNVVLLARLPVVNAKQYGLPATDDTHETFIVLKHVKANLGGYIPLTFFERTNRGLLLHRPDIKELDIEALQELELDEAENKKATTQIKMERDKQIIWDYIKECNDNGDSPNNTAVRQYVMNESGMAGNRIGDLLGMLELDGRVEKVYKKIKGRQTAQLKAVE